jgi:rSAM/selenodomain-associated transferase 2
MQPINKTRSERNLHTVGVVVPVLDEYSNLDAMLRQLAACDADQVVIVDGGSSDGSWEALRGTADGKRWLVLQSARGRARQMNAGADQCRCDIIMFVHADTRLPDDSVVEVRRALAATGRCWGRFDVRFHPGSPAMSLIAWFMNRRSCLTGICTGDQAMFATRDVLDSVGGVPDIALMEDIELSRRLKRVGRPACLELAVSTSDRRWRQGGVLATVCRMWWLRLRYWLGAEPGDLAREYRHVR